MTKLPFVCAFPVPSLVAKNLADFVVALNDLTEQKHHLGDPRLLSALGLLSALIGWRSKW